jgi:hypothetical protein
LKFNLYRYSTALDLALKYNHFTVADYLRRQGVPHAGDPGGGGGGGGFGYDGSLRAAGEAVGAAHYMSRGGGGGGGGYQDSPSAPSAPPAPESSTHTPSAPPVDPSLIFGSAGRDGGGGGHQRSAAAGGRVSGRAGAGAGAGADSSRGGRGGGHDTSGDEELARRLATEEFLAAQTGDEGAHGAGPLTPPWAGMMGSAAGISRGSGGGIRGGDGSLGGTPRAGADESPMSDASSTCYSDYKDEGELLRPD